MVLEVVNKLSLPVLGENIEIDLSRDLCPFEMKDFGECRCLSFPMLKSVLHDPMDDRMVVPVQDDVL